MIPTFVTVVPYVWRCTCERTSNHKRREQSLFFHCIVLARSLYISYSSSKEIQETQSIMCKFQSNFFFQFYYAHKCIVRATSLAFNSESLTKAKSAVYRMVCVATGHSSVYSGNYTASSCSNKALVQAVVSKISHRAAKKV